MKRQELVVAANVVWLALLSIVVAVVLVLTVSAVTDIHALLLNGRTASAISAKKTAKEVKLLIKQQAFDHQQTVNAEKQAATGQVELKAIVREVETHLDATIRTQVNQAAEKVAKEFGQ